MTIIIITIGFVMKEVRAGRFSLILTRCPSSIPWLGVDPGALIGLARSSLPSFHLSFSFFSLSYPLFLSLSLSLPTHSLFFTFALLSLDLFPLWFFSPLHLLSAASPTSSLVPPFFTSYLSPTFLSLPLLCLILFFFFFNFFFPFTSSSSI